MANPLTCQHNILGSGMKEKYAEGDIHLVSFIFCVSCNTDMTGSKYLKGRLYEYDIDNNAWVHVSMSSFKLREK